MITLRCRRFEYLLNDLRILRDLTLNVDVEVVVVEMVAGIEVTAVKEHYGGC